MHNRRWISGAEFLEGMEIVADLQMFFPVTGFYQFPTVTSGFQILFWTQNPPLATAYRFESGHRHQKREPRSGVLFFGIQGDGFKPMEMQQSGGLLPPGVSAGCSIVRSSPAVGTIAQNPWFSRGFGLFSFQFSRPGEKEILTDLRRRFLGITGEAIPIFCRGPDSFTNSLPFLSGFFQQGSLE